MEDLPLFQAQDEQFSASGMYFPEQQGELTSTIFDTKEDLKLLFDWQDHVGSIQDSFCDDLDMKFNIDLKTDLPDLDSPILTNALTSPVPIKIEPEVKKSLTGGEKILFPGDVEPLQVSSSIQTDNVLKRITQARSVLINGEKEILGKNIIGLHCLNEIKTSPDENCQITSTVMNGKRYKVIIRPRSAVRANQQTSLPPSNAIVKREPTDELISELQDGDYDVLGHEDVLDPWTLPLEEGEVLPDPEDVEEREEEAPSPPADPPRVPPLRIKIPKKLKKHKAKKEMLKAESLSELLYSFEEVDRQMGVKDSRTSLLRSTVQSSQSLSASHKKTPSTVPGDSVQLDHDYCSYKRRQSGTSFLTCDTVLAEKNPRKDSGLESGGVSDASEESPAPDTPEALYRPPTPESSETTDTTESHQPAAPILAQQLTSKLLEERRRIRNPHHVTKMAAALFRASNAATCGHKKLEPLVACSDTQGTLPQNCDIKTTSETIDEALSPGEPSADRPKKKLKLEEYLSRRHDKDKDDFGTDACENVQEEVCENAKSPGAVVVENSIDQCPTPEPGVPSPVDSSSESAMSVEVTGHSKLRESTNDCAMKELKVERKRRDSCELQDLKAETKKPCSESSKLIMSKEEAQRRESRNIRDQEPHRSPYASNSHESRSGRRAKRRHSSSSTSCDRSYRRKSSSRSHMGRSDSRDRWRSFWSPARRSSSRDSSSSSSGCSKRRSSLNSLRYRRRSRSRSRSPLRSVSRDNSKARSRGYGGRRRPYSGFTRQGGRSRSPVYSQREKQRQIEERRVVYVGRIPEGTTNQQLRQRFSAFGPIIDISVHFRERADNYGFVTFAYKDDAYQAVEHGNDDPALPHYDLCFGGRRSFCKQRYSDLDGMPTSYSGFKDAPVVRSRDESFDLLLKQAKAKLHMRKEVT